jgi:hypothetical protein
MASRGKKKTTFAKLNRETKLRERRAEKEARKQARKLGLEQPERISDTVAAEEFETVRVGTLETAPAEP